MRMKNLLIYFIIHSVKLLFRCLPPLKGIQRNVFITNYVHNNKQKRSMPTPSVSLPKENLKNLL